LARITAAAILKSVDHLPKEPKLWIVCGGGRHNPLIMSDLKQLAQQQGSETISAEDAGLNGDMMEAEGWAYLAIRAAEGLPLTYPNTTGVETPASGGVVAKP
ncbi:MAG: anhydro-N-acetylmuramic acid kinase, partial [Pseudomonadota bacterium]